MSPLRDIGEYISHKKKRRHRSKHTDTEPAHITPHESFQASTAAHKAVNLSNGARHPDNSLGQVITPGPRTSSTTSATGQGYQPRSLYETISSSTTRRSKPLIGNFLPAISSHYGRRPSLETANTAPADRNTTESTSSAVSNRVVSSYNSTISRNNEQSTNNSGLTSDSYPPGPVELPADSLRSEKPTIPRKARRPMDEPMVENYLSDDLMQKLEDAIGEIGRSDSEPDKNIVQLGKFAIKNKSEPDDLPIQKHPQAQKNETTAHDTPVGKLVAKQDHASNQTTLENKLKLTSIVNIILRATKQFPELTPENLDDAEASVVHILERYAKVCSGVKYIREQLRVLKTLESEKSTFNIQLQEFEEKFSALEIRLKTETDQNQELSRRVAALESEKDIQEANHNKNVNTVIDAYTERMKALQETVAQFEGVRKDLIRDHDAEKQRLRETHNAELKKQQRTHQQQWQAQQDTHQQQWQAQQDRHTSEVKAIRTDWTNERIQWNEVIKSMEKGHETDIQNMQRDFAQEREQWSESLEQAQKTHEAAIAKLTNQMTSEREKSSQRLQQERSDHKDKTTQLTNSIQNLKDGFSREKNQWTKGIDTLKEAMKNKYESERTEMKRKHEIQLAEMKNEYENELRELRQQHDYDEDELREELDKFKRIARQEQERLELELKKKDDEIVRIKNSVSKEVANHTKELQVRNEKLTRALVNRDHVKGLTDPQIGSLFKTLELLLNDFGRITWDASREQQWPFPEKTLQQFRGGSSKTKLLKQQIIQSYLWTILYEYIFVTPFEVLGEEGRALHQEWTDEFGRDRFSGTASHWPSPTEESEKDRYETMKRCKEEIQQKKGENQNRRESFEQTLAIIFADIAHTVERVSSLGLKESDLLKKLIKTAADSWLEICSQRYRILVVLPGPNGNVFKTSQRRSGGLRLIAKPEIRRIGNAKGQELDKGEVTIGGWQGVEHMYESH